MDNFFNQRGGNDRMLKNFTLNEFGLIAATYKHMFKDQLR